MTMLSRIHGTYDRMIDFDKLLLAGLFLHPKRGRNGVGFIKPRLRIFKDWMTLKDHLSEIVDVPSGKALSTVDYNRGTEPVGSEEDSPFVVFLPSTVNELNGARLISPRFARICAPVETDL